MSLSTTSSSSPSSSVSISSLPRVEDDERPEVAHARDRLGLAMAEGTSDGRSGKGLLVRTLRRTDTPECWLTLGFRARAG